MTRHLASLVSWYDLKKKKKKNSWYDLFYSFYYTKSFVSFIFFWQWIPVLVKAAKMQSINWPFYF